jgi:hypothetical protein
MAFQILAPPPPRAEDLRIPVRKVTDKTLGWSDTGENVLVRVLQFKRIQHTYEVSSQKLKK